MVKQERQRYVLFKIIYFDGGLVEKQEFINTLWKSIWRYFGMREANKIGLWLVEFDISNRYGVLRCSHETKEILITALTMIKHINGKKVIISPIKTSGTIRSLKNKYMNK